ncbi:MAG: hypothetical protein OXI43_22195 [Candidatus Poribacteria bacterium]|nr:hypothetical protein [Candidatus Poribacteria bacterium]
MDRTSMADLTLLKVVGTRRVPSTKVVRTLCGECLNGIHTVDLVP